MVFDFDGIYMCAMFLFLFQSNLKDVTQDVLVRIRNNTILKPRISHPYLINLNL